MDAAPRHDREHARVDSVRQRVPASHAVHRLGPRLEAATNIGAHRLVEWGVEDERLPEVGVVGSGVAGQQQKAHRERKQSEVGRHASSRLPHSHGASNEPVTTASIIDIEAEFAYFWANHELDKGIMPVFANPSPSAAPDPGREQTPRPGPRWKVPVLAAVLVLGGLAAYQLWPLTVGSDPTPLALSSTNTAKVVAGTFEKVVRVSGLTSAIVYENVRAPRQRGPEGRSLILLELLPSGTVVHKGDIVARIDGQGLRDHIDDVQSTVNQSLADVRKRRAELQVDWNNLKQNVTVAESNLEKWQHEATAAEVRTPIDRELLELGVEESEAAYQQKQKDLKFAKTSEAADLKILEIDTERDRTHLDRHVHDLQRYTVIAPMDGMVVRQPIIRNGEQSMPEVGDNLRPGQLFVRVMDTNNMQVEASVNQASSHLFKVGMEASIGLDAFPDVKLSGRILSIGAIAQSSTESEYVRSIPLYIKIEGSDSKLLPDLSAYADVILERRENVTQVPLGAVFEDDGQSYVFVRNGEGFDKRPVELGDRSYTSAVVASGLTPGDVVALDRPAS